VNSPEKAIWRRGDGSNLVGVLTSRLASAAFNESPTELHIAGVRGGHGDFFKLLAASPGRAEAAELFASYMVATFGLVPPPPEEDGETVRRRYRASYLRLLRGWAFDANASEGAVLKGWVESRFGMVPTFHKEPLTQYRSQAWARYVEEKMASRFHNNAIFGQLDLVYEFAQVVLRRFFEPERHWTLYRGVNDFDEHQIVERVTNNVVVLRLNNLVSFSRTREIASCFGDYILETSVPFAKVFLFNGLLEKDPLKGEGEVLVIGGDYRVKATYY
jgi:NAD+--dinitrogen-reductase ADP-D-ribosyltransferase